MKISCLAKTNPYLRNKKMRERLLYANIAGSTTIETGPLPSSVIRRLKQATAKKFTSGAREK